jgi:hypothetical protein
MKVLETHLNPSNYVPGLNELCMDAVLEGDEEEDVSPLLEQLKEVAKKNGMKCEVEETQNRRWLVALIAKVETLDDFRLYRFRAIKIFEQL